MNPMEKGVSNAKNKLWKCHGNDPYLALFIIRNTLRYDIETPKKYCDQGLNLFHDAH